jgi:hypothetical protein
MALCEQLLKSNIQSDCDNPMFGGYKPIGWIINKDDVESFEELLEDAQEGKLIEEIRLKQGAQAYRIQSIGSQPTATTQTFVKGTYYNTWTNVVNVALLDNSAGVTTNIVMPMASGAKFVVILEHERMNYGNPLFEIFGLDKGLSLQDGASREEYGADLKGGWMLALEETDAPVPAHYCVSREVINSLETPAV